MILGIARVTQTCHTYTVICCSRVIDHGFSNRGHVSSSCYRLQLLPAGRDSFIRARFSRILANALFLARGRWAVEYEGKICLENMRISRTGRNITSGSITYSTTQQGHPPLVSHLGLQKRLK